MELRCEKYDSSGDEYVIDGTHVLLGAFWIPATTFNKNSWWCRFKNLKINVEQIRPNAFYNAFYNLGAGITGLQMFYVKINTELIDTEAFKSDSNHNKIIHFWISKKCKQINGTTDFAKAPFYTCKSADFYCEHNSKPDGWHSYWNWTSTSGSATTYWGVSETDYNNRFI